MKDDKFCSEARQRLKDRIDAISDKHVLNGLYLLLTTLPGIKKQQRDFARAGGMGKVINISRGRG